MNKQQVGILNSLVTFAAENIPGGLSEDEAEVARIVGYWALESGDIPALTALGDRILAAMKQAGIEGPPTCPYCGEPAWYGDARHMWIRLHIDSRTHRWWWALKKKLKRR
jgi:hypothetical protein